MTNDHAETLPVQVGDAMLEGGAVDVEGGREIALHAKNSVAHQTHPAAARGSFSDVWRFFQLRFEEAFAESGRFFHGLVRHGAHRFLEVAEPAVLMEENARGHSGPDEGMRIDVTGVAGARVEDRDSEVPNKKKRSDETFGEQAMEGGFAERGHAGGEHHQAKEDQAGVERIKSDGEVAEDEIEGAPDDSKNGSVADFFSGADDEEGLVFSQGEEGIGLHWGEF